jgi:uncharacterized protein YndB with AHSA1/START domain
MMGVMASVFRFDRSFDFVVPPPVLWEVLERTDAYRQWWTWLRTFEVEGLVPGAKAHCVIRAPIPYSLRFDVLVEEVVAQELVIASVSGDMEGPARLEIAGTPEGSRARLMWEVELRDRLLASAARWARPIMEWGHEWVVATGVTQFRRRALPPRG